MSSISRQIAVLKEVEGKGPFCSLVMAVVVVKDVIVIVAFALNIELIRAVSLRIITSLHLISLLVVSQFMLHYDLSISRSSNPQSASLTYKLFTIILIPV